MCDTTTTSTIVQSDPWSDLVHQLEESVRHLDIAAPWPSKECVLPTKKTAAPLAVDVHRSCTSTPDATVAHSPTSPIVIASRSRTPTTPQQCHASPVVQGGRPTIQRKRSLSASHIELRTIQAVTDRMAKLSEAGTTNTTSDMLPSLPSVIPTRRRVARYSCLLERALVRSQDPEDSPGESTPTTHQRLHRSARKLADFFGDTPPIDVSVERIAREGLPAMLRSNVPLCYFLRSLLDEFCSENMFFYLDVEQYQAYPFSSPRERRAAASDIYRMYLSAQSRLEVNLTDRCRRGVAECIRKAEDDTSLRNCFDAAKSAVVSLLSDSLVRFQVSPQWKKMQQELGETYLYSEPVRNRSVAHLTRHAARRTLRPVARLSGVASEVAAHSGDPLLGKLIDEFLCTRFSDASLSGLEDAAARSVMQHSRSISSVSAVHSKCLAPLDDPAAMASTIRRAITPTMRRVQATQEAVRRSRSVSPGRMEQSARMVAEQSSDTGAPVYPRFVVTAPESTAPSHHQRNRSLGIFNAASIAIKRSVDNLRNRR